MLLVLEWPAISLMVTSEIEEPLVLQAPAVVGLFLVLLMGAGNYLGTRFTLAVILFALAEVCFVLSVCELRPESVSPDTLRVVGCVPLLLSIFAVLYAFSTWRCSKLGIERVWADFRDSFGVVWSRRVAERFNLMAKRDKLEVRIQNDGIIINGDSGCSESTIEQSREEQILRWILKRFVDEPWLNHRFGHSHETTMQTSSPDVKNSVDDNST